MIAQWENIHISLQSVLSVARAQFPPKAEYFQGISRLTSQTHCLHWYVCAHYIHVCVSFPKSYNCSICSVYFHQCLGKMNTCHFPSSRNSTFHCNSYTSCYIVRLLICISPWINKDSRPLQSVRQREKKFLRMWVKVSEFYKWNALPIYSGPQAYLSHRKQSFVLSFALTADTTLLPV